MQEPRILRRISPCIRLGRRAELQMSTYSFGAAPGAWRRLKVGGGAQSLREPEQRPPPHSMACFDGRPQQTEHQQASACRGQCQAHGELLRRALGPLASDGFKGFPACYGGLIPIQAGCRLWALLLHMACNTHQYPGHSTSVRHIVVGVAASFAPPPTFHVPPRSDLRGPDLPAQPNGMQLWSGRIDIMPRGRAPYCANIMQRKEGIACQERLAWCLPDGGAQMMFLACRMGIGFGFGGCTAVPICMCG